MSVTTKTDSAEFAGITSFLAEHGKVALTVHESPDGDAIGSEFAMVQALKQLGKTVMTCNADAAPQKFAFLDETNELQVVTTEDQLPADIGDYGLLILDTNDTNNIGHISELVLPRVKDHFIIDHHEAEDDILAGNLIQKSASSTAEILYQLFVALGLEVSYATARALFVAIVFDTGSFVYPKTTATTFGIARDLVAKGVVPNEMYARVYESNSVSSLMLQSRVFASLELLCDDRVALQVMTQETLQDYGAQYEEADQIINIPLMSESVQVSVFFKENNEGRMRCSMRSKGHVNVADIAVRFGGGGHKTAAGFRCPDGYDKARQKLLDALVPRLR